MKRLCSIEWSGTSQLLLNFLCLMASKFYTLAVIQGWAGSHHYARCVPDTVYFRCLHHGDQPQICSHYHEQLHVIYWKYSRFPNRWIMDAVVWLSLNTTAWEHACCHSYSVLIICAVWGYSMVRLRYESWATDDQRSVVALINKATLSFTSV